MYRKIRNTYRFILGNTGDFNVNKPVEYKDLLEIDKWALLKLNELVSNVTKNYDSYEFHAVYHNINEFCVVTMSNFYLDIIKDRLYTAKADSIERRAAQTVMYEILATLVKLLSPITCFTSEEVWSFMSHKENENCESVMLAKWPEEKAEYNNKTLEETWQKILKVKERVSKKLEEARAEKIIGQSLNAKVIIFATGEEYDFLKTVENELQIVFIVSGLEIINQENEEDIRIEVAEGEKCDRCWMYSETVGGDEEHPSICDRCKKNLKAV